MTEARPDLPVLDAGCLAQLQAGLLAVRGGDFSTRLPRSADPLLDGIADAFNEMAAHLPTLSHELRTPRNSVLAFARLLAQNPEEEKSRCTRPLPASADADPIELLALPADLRERIAARATATAPVSGMPRHAPLRGKKILVVDDDRRNVFAISSTLEQYGMDVISAGDGRAGIERLCGEPGTDLVLMDLMMPEMDGYAAITAIRDIPEFSRLPIIAVTAYTMSGDPDTSVPGANCCLTKPLDTDELLNRMERCLAAR